MLKFSRLETRDLLKAWIVLSIAFTIMLVGATVFESGLGSWILIAFAIALFTAGLAFLLHELAHKYMAQKYGCHAEFRADNQMLALAVIMSFFGIIFAVPGAVYFQGHVTRRQTGIIAAAGPFANLILGIVFLPGMLLLPGILGSICAYGFLINSWLGLFNMLPFGFFDGAKILRWNKVAYFSLVAILLAMTLYSFLR